MRATVIGISFLGVVALVPAGAIFGLNGEQWSWWRAASWAGALSFLVTVSAAAFRRERTESSHPGGKALGPAGILVGLAVIASSLTMMASRYSDPYSGPMFWPHALAVLAFAGLLVVELSLCALAGRSVDPAGTHS